jgi:hypothetical protein
MVHHRKNRIKGLAKWLIWSILHQNYLITRVHMYLWTAVSVLLFLVFAGVMSFEAAILSIFIGGLTNLFFLWLFIEVRRIWLLRIQDPEVRAVAHEAMIVYIHANRRVHKKLCRDRQDYWCKPGILD